MSSYASQFWTESAEYHDLAKKYLQNVEITNPKIVSCRYGNCSWCATAVKYYEYRGESV